MQAAVHASHMRPREPQAAFSLDPVDFHPPPGVRVTWHFVPSQQPAQQKPAWQRPAEIPVMPAFALLSTISHCLSSF